MTIYAIVNSLLPDSALSGVPRPVWTIVSSSGILQGGNPYFVPDFAERFEARTALALRIGKLGKGIAPKFAERYIDAVAPCVLFVAVDLIRSLREVGMPWSPAVSYDKCLALGKFSAFDFEGRNQYRISLDIECPEKAVGLEWRSEGLLPSIEETLSALSRDNTLKTGDIILVGLAREGSDVAPGMRVRLGLNGTDSLRFNIR